MLQYSVVAERTPSRGIVALVTGANRGIGAEIRRALVARGITVIAGARTDEPGFLPLDIRDPAQVQHAREYVERTYGALDILINNAGSGLPNDADPSTVDVATITAALETNCFGALRMIQALLPALRAGGRGRIINVSSGTASFGAIRYDTAAYRLSKACLNAYTAMLARELSQDGLAVNAMCPGHARTRMGGGGAPRSAAEAADTAIWLALDAPAFLSGHFFRDRQIIAW